MERVETICLVSCVGGKRAIPSPARDLYQSTWFTKARKYVDAIGCHWFILSAGHGLIHPDDVIPPYEQTLNRMGVVERRNWAHMVRHQMDERMPDAMNIVVLAGERYRQFLMGYLRRRGTVAVPMEGLQIGKQLSWLAQHTNHAQAR